MYTFQKFLGRYSLVPVMGTFSFGAILAIVPHFFIDMLLITTYRHGQSDFQRLYLCVHWALTILAMMTITYGFWAINKQTYHAISNFRSWTLLVGLSLFFSGFFSVIGFALDWHLFARQCSRELTKLHRNDEQTLHGTHAQDQASCRDIYDALLATHSFLWAVTEACLLVLFLTINSYKVTNFQQEERHRQEKSRRELAERNRRMGVRTRGRGDGEDEGKDDVEEMASEADVENQHGEEKGVVYAFPSPFDQTHQRTIQFAPLPDGRRNSARTSVSQAQDHLDSFQSPVEPPMAAFSYRQSDLVERLADMPTIVVQSPNGTPYSMSSVRSASQSSPLLAPLMQSRRAV